MFFAFFLPQANCWWAGPHEMIARIAKRTLEDDYPEEFSKVNEILRSIEGEGRYTYGIRGESEEANFVSINSWFDEVSAYPSYFLPTKPWHFVDKAYATPEALAIQKNYPNKYNVTTCLRQFIQSLNTPTTTSYWALNFIFRGLVHFVGDIHMPNHATERFEVRYGKVRGDFGANGFKLSVAGKPAITNLHKLWDSACVAYDKETVTDEQVNDILDTYGSPVGWYDLKELESRDPEVWAEESYRVAIAKSYDLDRIHYNIVLTPDCEYILEGQKASKKQILLAAHRLAFILEDYFAIPREYQKYDGSTIKPSFILLNLPISTIIILVIDCILLLVAVVYIIILFRIPRDKIANVVRKGALLQSLL